jgi:hypothetical protein
MDFWAWGYESTSRERCSTIVDVCAWADAVTSCAATGIYLWAYTRWITA